MSDKLNYETETDDALLRNLIALGEPDDAIEEVDDEVGEELFELFLEGKLDDEDRQQFLRFLDANPRARAATSEYLGFLESEAEEEEDAPATLSMPASSQQSWSVGSRWSSAVVAMAACLLLAVGLTYFGGGGGGEVAENQAYEKAQALLAESKFEEAREFIDESGAEGVGSTRLTLLAARAAMQEPNALISPDAWSLRRFDYEYDGTLIMDAEVPAEVQDRITRARSVVDAIEPTDQDPAEQLLDLTRGWLLLKANQPEAARDNFQAIATADPSSGPAAMGLGVAEFMIGGDRLEVAESAFRRLLEIEPESIAGRLNLAMCLSEAGKIAESLAEWQEIDLAKLPAEERAAAEQAIAQLKQGLEAKE